MNTEKAIAVKGLRTLRTANIISIVAIIFTMIGGIALVLFGSMGAGIGSTGVEADQAVAGGMILAAGAGGLVTLMSLLIGLVASIMEIVALSKMSAVQEGYKTALILVIANMALSVVFFLLPVSGIVKNLLNAIPSILVALVIYFVINATVVLLQNKGAQALADNAVKVRNLYMVSAAIVIVASLLSLIPVLAIIISLVSLIASVVMFVALIKYLVFLGNAAKELER